MQFEKRVTYVKPENSDEEKLWRHHRFEIKDNDGSIVSAAEVHYFTKPIPYYQLSFLYTEGEHQGRGYASAILDVVEKFLIERGKPGILEDAIYSDIPEVKTMYGRRGWKLINKHNNYVFNMGDIDPKVFIGYEMRGEEV